MINFGNENKAMIKYICFRLCIKIKFYKIIKTGLGRNSKKTFQTTILFWIFIILSDKNKQVATNKALLIKKCKE